METKGEIGAFYQDDKQIGGFTDWSIEVFREGITQTHISAKGFWMLKKPSSNKFLAQFYQRMVNDLVLINERSVKTSLPKEFELDTLIKTSIEMTDE